MKRARDYTNIPEGTCVCSVCKEEKDNREFYWYHDRKKKLNGTGRIRINTNCSSCISRISKEYNKLKREVIKTHPIPDYGSPCDLCGKPVYKSREDIPSGVDGKCTWQCDHDHDSVDFRGWLCKDCNVGLGKLGDTTDALEKALKYAAKCRGVEIKVEYMKGTGNEGLDQEKDQRV